MPQKQSRPTRHQSRENLDILFRRTAPETVLESLRHVDKFFEKKPFLCAGDGDYGERTFRHYAEQNLSNYSTEEMGIRFRDLEVSLKNSLFQPLVDYGNVVLEIKNYLPVCKLEELLNWNTTSLRLGQDLVITAWLAEENVLEAQRESCTHFFTWPAVVKTNDRRLEELFEKGLAENHFHLHGSTQSFALSWACLMNHPDYIHSFLKVKARFEENLYSGITKGIYDSQMEWKERLLYAAEIRALLFRRCLGETDSAEIAEKFISFDRLPLASSVKKSVESLRYLYGYKFKQSNGRKCCLDYANCSLMYSVLENHHNRLLAGERNFLYHIFSLHFQKKLSYRESMLFYLYLLIKSAFRSELIQNNGKPGFHNFSDYQDRKNQFFEIFPEYWEESFRLSICMAQKENHAISLEARIMPEKTAEELNKNIQQMDRLVKHAFEPKGGEANYYYVVHFAKMQYKLHQSEKRGLIVLPRNIESRKMAETAARALCKYTQYYDVPNCYGKQQRVWGLDAASFEIGCRPETFATEFRYLREESKKQNNRMWIKGDSHAQLGITYHVGEDFLDVMDGLRAIDEAMTFLQMKRGERLGHALALGIEAKEYYEFKNYNIYMTKQDWLDNLVWMLYRSLELNVDIKENHRAEMRIEANKLLHEIYRFDQSDRNANGRVLLDAYYDAWKLRGDHPFLYRSGQFRPVNICSGDVYNRYKKRNDDLDNIRDNYLCSSFYYLYHYDYEVKERGFESMGHEIGEWYIQLVGRFQQALQKEVHKRGLAIECNPTSNVLIGTFKYYNQHPILAFNDHILADKEDNPHIQVSINTDDIGVFDTSLENEYALVFEAIRRERYAIGNYNDDDIYIYLDYLRENGLRMAFRKI